MDIQTLLYNFIKLGQSTCLNAAQQLNMPHTDIIPALKSLESREILSAQLVTKTTTELTKLGQEAAQYGTPEFRLYKEVETPKNKSMCQFAAAAPGALRRKLIRLDTTAGKTDPMVLQQTPNTPDDVQTQLNSLDQLTEKDISALKKSKLLQDITTKHFLITAGPKFQEFGIAFESELTQAHLTQEGAEALRFKPLNFNARGKPVSVGALHPLLKFRTQFIAILTGMGFQQMKTANYLESSFWNFDALFQPQQHPARDMHDTFFVAGKYADFDLRNVDKSYFEAVKAAHEAGYKYIFDDKETCKNLLRTHTTAVSARRLYELAQDYKNGTFKPIKSFSIDRVFRNETLDATHLCEFHQVEGFICDVNVSLRDLMGTIKAFFKELGMENVRFKPTYNPYTEPSMEIFCHHPGLNKWIEVGNSGMFRPEMLRTMGFGPEVQCIAWGLSLERPTMIKYGINNIRDLIGPACDLDMICDCVEPGLE
ncbi:Phenylalanyl-tRNA synthetase alpha chain [Spironucleus salmonicida]|nr:Phenylalanyl-tRNA synthetase alpha chain [Spironucleus salmonicida]|eukprot:EST49516.1 Phenylalanyl-tRNA synthetase alpha chain [Spironucleus salmonicida]